MISERLNAIWQLQIPEVRELAGLHQFDGQVQDLSPGGVATMLAQIGHGDREPNAHDEAQLSAAEAGARASFETAELHRWNPLVHLSNLDLACYDREYAPADERAAAKAAHLSLWPEAVDGAIESLDSVPASVAAALLAPVRGLGTSIEPVETDPATRERARAALDRLIAHLETARSSGAPEVSLGRDKLARLLGDPEAMSVDLGRLEEIADAERKRLLEHLRHECDRLRSGVAPAEVVQDLLTDHPDDEGIYASARMLVDELSDFTAQRGLLPELGGTCLVGPAPASRRYAIAMISWTGPYEAEAPAWFYVNPPDATWDEDTRQRWRSMFSTTTLPAICAHEVTPGHFAHGRMIRLTARGDVRRSLYSFAFIEGWAHYAEELLVEQGFRSDDPRFAIGVWIAALIRVTRLASALGIHGGTMTLQEATIRFREDACMAEPGARSEAARATFDPTYGRYTWGKLEILALRDEAVARWGPRFSLRRFHEALLELGAPALGTLGDAFEPL
ncbi:MAG: DUF885 family protein [Acidimicrobiales bacterium]|jgi:hypothetical protein